MSQLVFPFDEVVQGPLVARLSSRQAADLLNREFSAYQYKCLLSLTEDELNEERLDLLTSKFEAGYKLSASDIKVLNSLFLPDLLRIFLTTGLPDEV